MSGVLVVDDNLELAENIGEILEAEGFDVRVVGDPERALELAQEFAFDVALMDIRMPGMDGVELHRRLLRIRPAATYVMMTAYTRDERIAEAIAAGATTVLPKPVPIERLLEELPVPNGTGPTVLIVEDDPDLRASLAEALRDQGYRPTQAATLAEARELLARSRPGAVLSDVRLPDGDGAVLARELADDPAVPVILMTAFDPSVVEEGTPHVRMLTKPFATAELLRTLGETARERASP